MHPNFLSRKSLPGFVSSFTVVAQPGGIRRIFDKPPPRQHQRCSGASYSIVIGIPPMQVLL